MDELREDYPEEGEQILFCDHQDEDHYHFWKFHRKEDPAEKAVSIEVGDHKGHTANIRWMVRCCDCTRRYPHPLDGPLHIGTWLGDNLHLSEHGVN